VVYCLGSCGLAPVAMVNEQTIGKIAPEKMSAILKSLE
jgi:NADH-quinone oxidoreductase subunit E